MGKVLALANHKGGVGKTTHSANLSRFLGKYYKNILVIDFDPQANLYNLFEGAPDGKSEYVTLVDIMDALVTKKSFEEIEALKNSAVTVNVYPNKSRLSILGGNLKLNQVKQNLQADPSGIHKIIKLIRFFATDYDLVVIDTPPSIELYTVASLAASDGFLIPVTMDYNALSGMEDILQIVKDDVTEHFNPDLNFIGVIAGEVEENTNIAEHFIGELKNMFGNDLLKPYIRKTVKVKEMTLLGKIAYDLPKLPIYTEYDKLTKEIKKRLEGL